MVDQFYRAFEDHCRGSRDVIKRRLAVYLPFVEPLLVFYPLAEAIDLGCGRGEWLEVLDSVGFQPHGVDLDRSMLDACVQLGLAVDECEAVAHLGTLGGESQTVVSALHLVEHISFDQLRTLVGEAMRVLKPGGLLIMETPNPENIVVATRNFYLDPTHQRPLPPGLLSFVAQYAGFSRVRTIRLQESKDLCGSDRASLHDVLAGVSPDYAVVAQKKGSDALMGTLNASFSRDFGLTLETLTSRYDKRLDVAEARVTQVEAHAAQAEAHASQAAVRATQAEARAAQAEIQTTELLNSTSWRMTAPLRCVGGAIRRVTPSALKPTVKILLQHAALYVGRRPRLKRLVLAILTRVPGLKSRLTQAVLATTVSLWNQPQAVPAEIAHLTPRARQIYADLKAAIAHRKKESG